MGKFDIDGVTKTRFASIQDGEEWSEQIQKSAWYKSRLYINKIEIVLWIRLALFVLEKQIRTSKIANLFANDGDIKNDGVETGSFTDFVKEAGSHEERHRRDMKEADFEYQKDFISNHKKDSVSLSSLFFVLKNGVKYSYLIINSLILAFILGICIHNYRRSQEIAEMNSKANTDIAQAWYEPGQKTYESVWKEYSNGTIMQFDGQMSNGYRFEMTLCNDNGKASGAYVYNDLSSAKDLPKRIVDDNFDDDDYDDDDRYGDNSDQLLSDEIEEEYSRYDCAALTLKGKIKGDVFTPGKEVSVNLTEYDSKNHKVGSFKGKGIVDNDKRLLISGTFKNHEGQKNSFTMSLSKSVCVESFDKIVNSLLNEKAIRKILYLNEKENPYAIIVDKSREIRMLKYIDAFTDYESEAQNSTPYFGTYDKKNVIVDNDCIVLRRRSDWDTYSDGVDNNIPAECISIIDLRGDSPKFDTTIDGVIWNDAKWISDKMFYSVIIGEVTTIKGYNRYGEEVSDATLPIFHVAITSPGIIEGETWEEDSEGNFNPVTRTYDFEGNELK